MDRIRTQIRASFLFQDEAVLDLAMKLARFEAGTPDGYRTLAGVLPTYDSLTQKELAAVSARYLDFRRAAIVWALPAAAGLAGGERRRGKKAGKKTGKKAGKGSGKKTGKGRRK